MSSANILTRGELDSAWKSWSKPRGLSIQSTEAQPAAIPVSPTASLLQLQCSSSFTSKDQSFRILSGADANSLLQWSARSLPSTQMVNAHQRLADTLYGPQRASRRSRVQCSRDASYFRYPGVLTPATGVLLLAASYLYNSR
eukprot:scaffold1533_cov388-Prasinococcus_capsulatus_cf.AAC.11